ncbi:MAG: aminotransferase class I/II-fold pyridoxal phosphate-dependent enzyme [Clostridia bacterium]|nr:aminotransferase class I/II-fold pyridoxal phosphate-dependent enzyme [Clostridia bacterium]
MDYENTVSRVARDIKPSGIRKFFDIAATMDDVISLSIGEPDFDTPWHIREAGIISLEQGKTHYTSNAGLLELREAISEYLSRRFKLTYAAEEIVVTVGGSEGIDAAIRTLVEPGDEVLIPEPAFVCYDPLTRLAGGVPKPIVTRAEDEFRLTAEALKEAITPKTKLLVLPYPNNPTGAVMRREDLEAIADVLRDTNIYVLSDEIYAELTYGKVRHISFASIKGMAERTILVSGFSKSFAMTGWRLGYIAAPAPLTKIMLKVHQYGIMSSPSTSQYAAVEAMVNGDGDIAAMRTEYNDRRKFLLKGLRELGFPTFEPLGAFYIFPSVSHLGMSSEEFCKKLIQEQRLAVVPGNAFGESGEGHVRISYAYSKAHLKEALRRLEIFVKDHKR